MDKAFPQGVDQIVVVIDGKTPELAEAAAQRLTEKLEQRPELYRSVVRPDGGPFFDRNALLFMPLAELIKRRRSFPRPGRFLRRLRPIRACAELWMLYSFVGEGVVQKLEPR